MSFSRRLVVRFAGRKRKSVFESGVQFYFSANTCVRDVAAKSLILFQRNEMVDFREGHIEFAFRTERRKMRTVRPIGKQACAINRYSGGDTVGEVSGGANRVLSAHAITHRRRRSWTCGRLARGTFEKCLGISHYSGYGDLSHIS